MRRYCSKSLLHPEDTNKKIRTNPAAVSKILSANFVLLYFLESIVKKYGDENWDAMKDRVMKVKKPGKCNIKNQRFNQFTASVSELNIFTL